MTQQTRRPGTIPGKKKATLYLDEKIHRALRVRAAETGESMGDIAERALRKELGMMEYYNCYACDGDYTEGYWLDADGTDIFYCTECGEKQGLDESPYARKHEAE